MASKLCYDTRENYIYTYRENKYLNLETKEFWTATHYSILFKKITMSYIKFILKVKIIFKPKRFIFVAPFKYWQKNKY